ncbi:MAG: STAS domain-containing protein, partial [Chloroflexi bacterium]
PKPQRDELLAALAGPPVANETEGEDALDARRRAIDTYLNRLSPLAVGTAGGNTPCIEIQSGPDLFIIDAGTGIRDLGHHLMNGPCGHGEGVIHLFFSHPHWDHIQGFPFFRPAFIPGNKIYIYSVHDIETALRRQQEFISFPISLDYMQATKIFTRIAPNEVLDFGDLRIRNICNHHPGDAYSFRFEKGNKAFVYASDASYPDGKDMRPALNFFTDADLLIFDAQFTQRESDEKEDWGHSSSFVGMEMAQQAGVKNLVLFHPDPTYTDDDLQKILEDTLKFQQNQYPGAPPVQVMIAQEGQTFDLTPPQTAQVQKVPGSQAAILKPSGIFDEHVATQLREQLAELVKNDATAQVVIDMTEVEMLQVAGLRGLVKLRKEHQSIPMALAGPSINVQQLIELAGYLDFFAIYSSVHAALNALKTRETLHLPGQILKNRYKVEQKIGEGHLGTVFNATDLQQNSPVAIKILSPSFSDTAIEQFLRQARQIVNLHHPNIVDVYDCDADRGISFMAEELVDSQTLREKIDAAHGPLPFKIAFSVAQSVIRALDYAHSHGVIHGDLKPKNILLAGNQVKISDFGLGWLEGGKALINIDVPLQSARYLAPEQVQGRPIDTRTDLYIFGAILYEMFTGQSVFNGQEPSPGEGLTPPRRVNPNISQPLEHLMLKLLNKDPAQRCGSARQVRQILNSMALAGSRERHNHSFTIHRSPQLEGRQPLLEQIWALWQQARQGQGQVVLLTGHAGAGKTRLLQELVCNLNDAAVLLGAGQTADKYPPYAAFTSALADYFAATPPDVAAQHLGYVWQAVTQFVPQAGQLLDSAAPPVAGDSPATDVLAALTQTTAARPWLLALDDLHLADSGTLKLLDHLIQLASGLSLLIVAGFEPEAAGRNPLLANLVERAQSLENCTQILLEPLTESDIRRLLHSIWAQSVPTDLISAVFKRTQGSPLFAEMIANNLIDEGVANWRDEKWHFGPVMD